MDPIFTITEDHVQGLCEEFIDRELTDSEMDELRRHMREFLYDDVDALIDNAILQYIMDIVPEVPTGDL